MISDALHFLNSLKTKSSLLYLLWIKRLAGITGPELFEIKKIFFFPRKILCCIACMLINLPAGPRAGD